MPGSPFNRRSATVPRKLHGARRRLRSFAYRNAFDMVIIMLYSLMTPLTSIE